MITLSFHPSPRFQYLWSVALLVAAVGSISFFTVYKGFNLPIQALSFTAETPIVMASVEPATSAQRTEPTPAPFLSIVKSGKRGEPNLSDAREEVVAMMAVFWARSKPTINPQQGNDLALAAVAYQQQFYGAAHYTSAEDTLKRIMHGYFHYYNSEVWEGVNVDDMKSELQKGNILILPVNGQMLNNPALGTPGPEHHMLLVTGYDMIKNQFITNDPGALKGEGVRYSPELLTKAMTNYPTQEIVPATTARAATAMIVVHKQ